MKTEAIKVYHSQEVVDGWFTKQVANFERTRFGWMAILITVQTCIGSLACMYIFKNNASDLMLVPCVVITMACNSVFIAQGPARLCLILFYTSIILNLGFIVLNF